MDVVGADEDYAGGIGELADRGCELKAVETGHPDIEEHGVETSLLHGDQGLLGTRGDADRLHPPRRLEKIHQVVTGMSLVIDHKDVRQRHAVIPARNLGTQNEAVSPSPTSESRLRR